MAINVVAMGAASAQTLAGVEVQMGLIVRIVPAKGTAGSGLIIAVEPNRVRILTARHVVEADVVIPSTALQKPDLSTRRTCSTANLPIRVMFRFESEPVNVATAYCSDAIDAAVIEVDRPAKLNNEIRPFARQRRLTDEPGYEVFLAGLAGGTTWTPLSGAVASKSPDNLQVRGARGIGIGPGFSGGAVFDTDYAFVGMIVRAGDTLVNVIPAPKLNQLLESWRVNTTHLQGAPTQPENPRFAGARGGNARVENARNAIRRYRGAFESMEAALLMKAYPNIGKKPLSLFGDASDIKLDLAKCSDINLASSPVLAIRCAYDLRVTRKTGPLFQASSCDYVPPGGEAAACPKPGELCSPGRMVFSLKSSGQVDDPFEWEITDVDVDSTGMCPKPESVKGSP